MIGFHIDMNMAHFTREYLESWLHRLARLGYDTVVWEVENSIRWESCPECASPDAFEKDEFRKIVALCRNLGLEPIPLLQTIGHAEYVLKHPKYAHLAETEGHIDQYCPCHGELRPFLAGWIDEYLDLFGAVSHFHLGADEAWSLGTCERCRQYADAHSLSELYVDHINAVAQPLVRRNVTPIIWADMALHHNEALDKLSRDIMLFDWMYDIRQGMGKFWVWGRGWVANESIPAEVLEKFGDYLFPDGDEPGRDPEVFYTADYLASQGFRVVTCPAASSYGDNVFSPRNWYHLANIADSFRKGTQTTLAGSVLTSWTVHLFAWELQLAHISLGPRVTERPQGALRGYMDDFTKEHFGEESADFQLACGMLSKRCLFTHTSSLGFDKSARPVPLDHAATTIERIESEGRVEEELENTLARLGEYRQGLALFEALGENAAAGQKLLYPWVLAAQNLVNRAEASAALLSAAKGERPRVEHILEVMRALREETEASYGEVIKPARRREMMEWIYASVEAALAGIA